MNVRVEKTISTRLNVNLSQNVAKWVYNHVLSHRIIPVKLQLVQFVSNLIQLFVTWHVSVTCFLFLFIAWLHLNDFFPHPKFYIPKHTSKVKFTAGVLCEIKSIQYQNKTLFHFLAQQLRYVSRSTKKIVFWQKLGDFKTFMFDFLIIDKDNNNNC